jgi:type I restriction enzyme R subunit
VNLDETGITVEDIIARRPVDAYTGQPVSAEDLRALYHKTSYEDHVLLPDRVLAMTQDLFKYLIETGGPEQKTIIFCVRDRHADDVAAQLNNLYAKWCAENGKPRLEPYAFKCTASVSGGEYLADLRGASRSHFIATTVDLLTTGVDVPCVRNIVFFKYVRSPISFYQMIGRGTRIDLPSNKLMFRVYDYTNATRLFGEEFRTKATVKSKPPMEGVPPEPPEVTVLVEGFDVRVTNAGRYIVTQVDGRAMPVTVEEYKQRLAAKLVEEAGTLERFRAHWIHPAMRREMLGHLPDAGRSAELVRELESMGDYDLYDVLAELGYGSAPRTRAERADAFTYKNEDWLGRMPVSTSTTIKAVAAQFKRGGTEELENPRIFETPEVERAGGLDGLRQFGTPSEVLFETKERMFSA